MAREGSSGLKFWDRWRGKKGKASDAPADPIEYDAATAPTEPPGPMSDEEVPPDISDIRNLRARTGPQALKVVYVNSLSADPKTAMWPQLFVDYAADMMVAAKRYSVVDFYRVFSECKEDAEEKGPTMKMSFLTYLAGWLRGAPFTRVKPGVPPQPDWCIPVCPPECLDEVAPQLTAIKAGVKSIRRETVALYDVFSGLKML